MTELAKDAETRRQSAAVSKDRKEIYLGESLRQALAGREENLTTVVNMLADRYMGMVERAGVTPMMGHHQELYVAVLKEVGRPATARDIATLPSLVEDYLRRHPEFPQEPGKTALSILRNSSFTDLVALVDRLERQP
jgi:hypothetical protein